MTDTWHLAAHLAVKLPQELCSLRRDDDGGNNEVRDGVGFDEL